MTTSTNSSGPSPNQQQTADTLIRAIDNQHSYRTAANLNKYITSTLEAVATQDRDAVMALMNIHVAGKDLKLRITPKHPARPFFDAFIQRITSSNQLFQISLTLELDTDQTHYENAAGLFRFLLWLLQAHLLWTDHHGDSRELGATLKQAQPSEDRKNLVINELSEGMSPDMAVAFATHVNEKRNQQSPENELLNLSQIFDPEHLGLKGGARKSHKMATRGWLIRLIDRDLPKT